MSLINEALKKAQKQRTGESPSLSSMPTIGGQKASQIARRGGPSELNTLLVRLGLGVGVLAVLIVGGVLLFRSQGPDIPPAVVATTPAPSPQAAAPATPAATTPATVTVTVATPAATTASTFVVPSATPPAPEPARVEPAPAAPLPVIAQTPAPVAEPPRTEPVRPATPAKLEPRAINYIEGIRVAGIRASSTDSKVLMNDRVYRLGDTVEHELGLRLVGITSHSLTFEDDRGAKYTRSF
ncbi:MAG TPA: hypothetical protein VHN79_06535 [Lacunisphaera sp.]|nr:hypothetical protein [Lacunisphaera sp.]